MAEGKVDEPKAEAPAETPAEAPKDAEVAAPPTSEEAKDGEAAPADAAGGDAAAAEAPAFDLANKLTPIFLSGASQEIFACVADSPDGVTEDAPQKFIPLEKILEDMRMRAAVSDFSVVKEEMKAFKGEEVLVVYDPDFANGQNFFTFTTEVVKQEYLASLKVAEVVEQAAEKEAEAAGAEPDSDDDMDDVPARREGPWVSLGSEIEIQECALPASKPRARIAISRRRRYFGSPLSFSNTERPSAEDIEAAGPDVDKMNLTSVEFPTIEPLEDAPEPIHRMLLDSEVTAIPVTNATGSQTTWPCPRNMWTQYKSRGVGDETDEGNKVIMASTGTDPAPPVRRQSVASATTNTKDEPEPEPKDLLAEFLGNVYADVSHALQENEIIDLFADDFRLLKGANEAPVSYRSEGNDLAEFQSFKYVEGNDDSQTTITAAEWHPNISGIICVATAAKVSYSTRIEKSVARGSSKVLIWKITNPIDPVVLLEAPDDIFSIAFNPSDPDILAGGCINGQVVLWNLAPYRTAMERTGPVIHEKKSKEVTFGEEKQVRTPTLRYIAVSEIEHGHRSCVQDIQWLPLGIAINNKGHFAPAPPNVATQLISLAADENALFWDLTPPSDDKKPAGGMAMGMGARASKASPFEQFESNKWKTNLKNLDLTWRPTLKVSFVTEKGIDNGGRRFCFDLPENYMDTKDTEDAKEGDEDEDAAKKLSSHLFVGTERGSILYLDWVPPETDSGKLGVQKIDKQMAPHHGPVTTIKRSPFIKDLILSVGGMSFCIWKEDLLEEAILTSISSGPSMTDGVWSPIRPGVFFISRADGNVDVWDLCDTSYAPTVTTSVCSPIAITRLMIAKRVNKDGQCFMAAADDDASLHVLEIPVTLKMMADGELAQVNALIDNEVKRIESHSKRENVPSKEEKEDGEDEEEEESGDDKLARLGKVFQAFQAVEKQFLLDMGLIEEAPPPEDDDDA